MPPPPHPLSPASQALGEIRQQRSIAMPRPWQLFWSPAGAAAAAASAPALLITSKPRPLSAPAGLFLNTKSDLGPCEFELHEDHLDWDALKADYDALAEREKERCVWACCCCRRCCRRPVAGRPRWRAAVARHGMGAGMWDGWGGGGGAA